MSANELPVGVLKATPEDFVVQELVGNPPNAVPYSEKTVIQGWDGKSAITIFEMSKRQWETQMAVREVARQLGVRFEDISFHGIKDKHACTSQLICVQGKFRPDFSHTDISLVQLSGKDISWVQFAHKDPKDFVVWGSSGNTPNAVPSRLRRGGNKGNRFGIFIGSTASALNLAAVAAPIPNVFGTQRLGRPGSEQIGRLFLEGEYKEAITLLLATPSRPIFLKAKQLAGGSDEGALSHPEFQFSFNFEIMKWQSYLWNKLLQEQVVRFGGKVPARLPMWNLDDRVRGMYRHLWNPPQLDQKVLERVVVSARPTILRPANFQAKREALGWRFSFDLQAGEFATVVLSQLFQLEEDHHRSKEEVRQDVVLPQLSAEAKERADLIDRVMKMVFPRSP